jgi:hypothetical protein
MTTDYVIIYLLAGTTLLIVLAIAGWQMYRTKRAKKTGEHSAFAERRGTGGR